MQGRGVDQSLAGAVQRSYVTRYMWKIRGGGWGAEWCGVTGCHLLFYEYEVHVQNRIICAALQGNLLIMVEKIQMSSQYQ